jgi:TusA-related sulfurtransferase
MTADITVDAKGRACPMPIIELARALDAAEASAVVLLLATDPGVEPDVKAFCQATGNALERFESEAGEYRAWVRKAGQPRPSGGN